jgi:4-hydroxy-3-methylbut-2-enyl diphosphate reductase
MAQIIRASDMGFCMGVRRAIDMMEHEAAPGRPIFSIGEIVHNPVVVEGLAARGVNQLPGPDDVDGDIGAATLQRVPRGRVAVTAHGVGEKAMRELEASGLEIVDTTCPIVTRAQRYAQKMVRDGYFVLVYGDPDHKEVRGIMGWAVGKDGRSRARVVRTCEMSELRPLIDEWEDGFPNKVAVMAQTTHKIEDFAKFVSNLMVLQRDNNFELHVVNTLCHATTAQQEAAARLAAATDVVIVVGGKKSANTRHLREVCEENGTPAYHIEGPDDLQADWLEGRERIGLTAGASTPDLSVQQVEARIRELVAT